MQTRPKLVAFTLVTSGPKADLAYERVKAIDIEGAKALVEKGQTVLNVLKGHPEVVG